MNTSSRDTTVAQQGVDGRLTAAEFDEQLHRFARAALFEHRAQEAQTCVPIEDALFLEGREGVGRQDLGPFVAVVAGCVTASEDVREAVRKAIERGRAHHRHVLAYLVQNLI